MKEHATHEHYVYVTGFLFDLSVTSIHLRVLPFLDSLFDLWFKKTKVVFYLQTDNSVVNKTNSSNNDDSDCEHTMYIIVVCLITM